MLAGHPVKTEPTLLRCVLRLFLCAFLRIRPKTMLDVTSVRGFLNVPDAVLVCSHAAEL